MSYKRVLLKLSGEALKENSDAILSADALQSMAEMVKKIHEAGVQICIVIGAGNIWRGKIAKDAGMDQYEADFMGMMGTVINAVALSAKLKLLGVPSLVTSAIGPVKEVNVPYSVEVADQAMNEGKVVFLSGGTGKPEEMLKKIIGGKVNKYFAEMVLVEQPYLLDTESGKKVGQVLEEKKTNVLKYVRYQVGEGIEKRKDDFASEVMSQMK